MSVRDTRTRYLAALAGIFVGSIFLASTDMARSAELGLTVADVRQRAASFNRQYLSAQQDLAQARARVSEARAGVFPDISLNGTYARSFLIPSFFITQSVTDTAEDGAVSTHDQTMALRTGFKNSFGANLTVSQAIWNGGKVLTAWAIAKLYHRYADLNLSAAGDNVEYNADQLFYGAILQRSRLETLQKAHEATSYNLQVVEKQYNEGVVSQFELLRARVENANLEPQILQAESDLRLAEQRLKSFIGVNLRDTVHLVESADDTVLTGMPAVDELTTAALEKRPEMQAATTLTQITKKAVSIAKADYQPTLNAQYSYGWQAASDRFTLSSNQSKSSTIGLSLSVPIFKGGRIGAQVDYYRADYNKTRIAEQQLIDDITLEVQQAYDQLMQAKKSLDIQKETIAQADEGLKIANLRYQQGVGTQLEVLSAQSALTAARSSLAQALYFFRTSKSGLKKATTIDLDAR